MYTGPKHGEFQVTSECTGFIGAWNNKSGRQRTRRVENVIEDAQERESDVRQPRQASDGLCRRQKAISGSSSIVAVTHGCVRSDRMKEDAV